MREQFSELLHIWGFNETGSLVCNSAEARGSEAIKELFTGSD